MAKWSSTVLPKLAEEENTCRAEEAHAFKRLYDAAVLQKAQAQKETWKTLEPMFTSLESRIKNMKSLMLAEVTPMSIEEKVGPSIPFVLGSLRLTPSSAGRASFLDSR